MMGLHLWHNLSSGPNPPDVIYAVVEVPKGSRNKYEYSKSAGVIKLDRVLYSPLHYPGGAARVSQAVDVDLLARAIAWCGEAGAARNEAFNVTNGDVFTWENVWPAIADALEMKPGRPEPLSLAQQRRIDAERRDQIHRATHGFANDQDRAKDAPVPRLALLQFAQKILLRPVEIRLLVHFRAAFARRHRERAHVDAIRLGTLQQRNMAEPWRNRFERLHQIAQHHVVGSDLVWIAPAVDQIRRFIERGIDKMGCILQRSCGLRALRSIGQIDLNVAGAVELSRFAPR